MKINATTNKRETENKKRGKIRHQHRESERRHVLLTDIWSMSVRECMCVRIQARIYIVPCTLWYTCSYRKRLVLVHLTVNVYIHKSAYKFPVCVRRCKCV